MARCFLSRRSHGDSCRSAGSDRAQADAPERDHTIPEDDRRARGSLTCAEGPIGAAGEAGGMQMSGPAATAVLSRRGVGLPPWGGCACIVGWHSTTLAKQDTHVAGDDGT